MCMVSWVCMNGLDMECGRGKLQQTPDMVSSQKAILLKFRQRKLRRICQTTQRLLIQSISAATDYCVQPLHIAWSMFKAHNPYFTKHVHEVTRWAWFFGNAYWNVHIYLHSKWLKRSVPGPGWRRRPRHGVVPHSAFRLWDSLRSQRAGFLNECCKSEPLEPTESIIYDEVFV